MSFHRLLTCALLVAAPALAADSKLSLQGHVLTPNGKPLAGARVYIYEAEPRVGIGAACPSCYPECAKTATTDRAGRYTIAGLGDHLLYRVLFVANERVPEFRERVDPLTGPLDQALRTRDTTLAPGLRTLVGHVVDAHGRPVPGATLSPVGMHVGDATMFGALDQFNARIDPVVVSDGDGEFRLTGPDSVRAWVLSVRARALSPKTFPEVEAAPKPALLKLETGATLTGLVLREGTPAPGVPICIEMVERDASTYARLDTVVTDEQGRYTLVNVPASQDYALTSIVGASGPWALRTVVRTAGEDDSVTALPPLQLERGFRLSGRVLLADGKPVPRGVTLALTRALAGGVVTVPLDEQGRFAIEGLPPETVNLNIRLRGYHFATATADHSLRYRGLRVAMTRDRADLKLVLEPDPPASAASGNPRPGSAAPENQTATLVKGWPSALRSGSTCRAPSPAPTRTAASEPGRTAAGSRGSRRRGRTSCAR